MSITAPDYYPKFRCTGTQCEDTCCSGWWNIGVDRNTYARYEQISEPALAPLFKLALGKDSQPDTRDDSNYGYMRMKPDGGCYFLQADHLCAIHIQLGLSALADSCRLYPRYLNRFGNQQENSLGISCPEAARLVLLNPQPMQITTIETQAGIDDKPFRSYSFPLQGEGDPQQIAILNDFRAVLIAILQMRELSLGARMMMLGFFLEDASAILHAEKFAHASELVPVLENYVGMLAHPVQIEAQFSQINPDLPYKLKIVANMLETSLGGRASPRFLECLQAAQAGLGDAGSAVANYTAAHADYYLPFFKDKSYIFENYLVNQMLNRLFPFTRGSFLDLYRELVFNMSLVRVLLVGIAGHRRGLDESIVIQTFQTFARNSNHNRGHLDNLLASLAPGKQDSFVSVMWMLKE